MKLHRTSTAAAASHAAAKLERIVSSPLNCELNIPPLVLEDVVAAPAAGVVVAGVEPPAVVGPLPPPPAPALQKIPLSLSKSLR